MTESKIAPSRPSIQVVTADDIAVDAKCSSDSSSSLRKGLASPICVTENIVAQEVDENGNLASTEFKRPGRVGRFALPAAAILVLAWWASSIALPYSRHRW